MRRGDERGREIGVAQKGGEEGNIGEFREMICQRLGWVEGGRQAGREIEPAGDKIPDALIDDLHQLPDQARLRDGLTHRCGDIGHGSDALCNI